MTEQCGLPALIENDARAGAIGESVYRRRLEGVTPIDTLIYIKAGSAIGGAYLVDGTPLVGQGGLAGDISHIPIEAAAGRPASVATLAAWKPSPRPTRFEPTWLSPASSTRTTHSSWPQRAAACPKSLRHPPGGDTPGTQRRPPRVLPGTPGSHRRWSTLRRRRLHGRSARGTPSILPPLDHGTPRDRIVSIRARSGALGAFDTHPLKISKENPLMTKPRMRSPVSTSNPRRSRPTSRPPTTLSSRAVRS